MFPHNDTDTTKQKVWSLNLEPIIFKLVHGDDAEGWDEARARRAAEEYRRFLFLAVTQSTPLVPSKEVDKVWHAHILDTAKYREDCRVAFGFFLDHFPYFGMRGEEDKENLRKSFAASKAVYNATFGENKSECCSTGPGECTGIAETRPSECQGSDGGGCYDLVSKASHREADIRVDHLQRNIRPTFATIPMHA